MRGTRRNGFSLIELLIVVVIIGILVGILLPTLWVTKRNAKRRQATAAIKVIASAIQNYQFQKRKWPCPEEDQGEADHTYSNNNYLVIQKLTNTVPPLLELGDFRTDANGSLLDPWGTYYCIRLDTDYSGYVQQNGTHYGYYVWCTNSYY